jgi:L-2-hydroxyglutarate oxidase LhgO
MIEVDVTIVGGGIVGCAVAAELARFLSRVVLLEKEPRLAAGVTSRNSEVAHGGMYYPTGSLKARTCVRGRHLLKEFCARAGVAYRECGKLIVAVTPAEEPGLTRLLALGQANGVEDLRLLERHEIAALEPEVTATAALASPRTAVLDAEGAARAFGRLAGERGAQVLTGATVSGLRRVADGWDVAAVRGASEAWTHRSRWVVNAAGIHGDTVAAFAGCDPDAEGLRLRWSKGNYFAVAPSHAGRVRRLIYPVPPADGSSLGVHVCLDLAGQMRLGPDVEAMDGCAPRREDYVVDPGRRTAFFASARTFLPFLAESDLTPALAGIRPRLDRASRGFADFVIRRETGERDGLVNLVGIESPGLTAAPAIAEIVGRMLAEDDT